MKTSKNNIKNNCFKLIYIYSHFDYRDQDYNHSKKYFFKTNIKKIYVDNTLFKILGHMIMAVYKWVGVIYTIYY